MKLSEIAIKNSVLSWMIMAGLILFGLVALRSLGIGQMPDVDFPVVSVTVDYEGAAPEIIETDVVDIIEESCMTVQGLTTISSSSKDGQATITLEFELNRNIDQALQDVQTVIAQAQKRLPKDMDPPVITKFNPEDQPIMWVSLAANAPARELMEYGRDHVKDKLQTVSGVGEVILGGYIEPNVRIWINPKKLDQYDLTVTDVLAAIQSEHKETPAGRIETSTTEYNIRYYGEAATPEELSNIQISRRGGAPIYSPIPLKEVARVVKGLEDVRRISRTNLTPAIGLGIKKQRGFNAVAVADAVKERLAEINKTLPEGYIGRVNFDSTQFIKHAIGEMKFDLVLSALLTGVVCFLFLASFGSTFNILLAIPTSIIGALFYLMLFGFTLNTFTLMGLTLAIGIVVDDAIMVLENIVRHQEMGKSRLQAAIDGVKEISSAAIATTIAIVAIFIPVIFMEGVIGKFFFQFGISLTVAVLLSLLEALTLTPMRCARMTLTHAESTGWGKKVHHFFEQLIKRYTNTLQYCLGHKKRVLIGALIFFVGSFFLLPSIKKEFLPTQDQSMFLLILQTPLGSSIEYTDSIAKKAEEAVMKNPSVERYYSAVGGFSGGEVNRTMIFLTLKDKKDRPLDEKLGHRPSQEDLMSSLKAEVSAAVPGIFVMAQDLSTRGFTAQRGFPIEFSVRGPDWNKLAELSGSLKDKMKDNPYFTDVDTDYRFGQPEIQVIPNREEAFKRGVRIEDIGMVINGLIGGIKSGKMTEGSRRNDIRVRIEDENRQTADDIGKVFVRNTQGELVKLADVVTIKDKKSLQSITRKDRERSIGIFCNLKYDDKTGKTVDQAKAIEEVNRLAKELLPADYRVVMSGSSEAFKKSFNNLGFALILGIVVAYMVLGSQYNSFVHPITVLLALPFSLSGAFIGLWLTGYTLNLYSFIGLILLMGIAKKNSILLVDFTNQRRREGLSVEQALLTACPQRLRPILMTSVAIIAAAIPPALAMGPGSETRAPMSVVIIGGMLASTLLTLFVVPCAYTVFARFEKKRYEKESI